MGTERTPRIDVELRQGDAATTTLRYRDPRSGEMRAVLTPLVVEQHLISVFNTAPTSDGAAAYWTWSMEAGCVHRALIDWLTTDVTLPAQVVQAVQRELWDRLQDGRDATLRLDLQHSPITTLAS